MLIVLLGWDNCKNGQIPGEWQMFGKCRKVNHEECSNGKAL